MTKDTKKAKNAIANKLDIETTAGVLCYHCAMLHSERGEWAGYPIISVITHQSAACYNCDSGHIK